MNKINPVKISSVIISFNEEKNIERCLQSILEVSDEIIIVDSYSNDSTQEICNRYPVRFIQHMFEGYIEQKNWAMDQATNDYILSLDADEALSDTMKESILKIKLNWKYDSYSFNRCTNYCGQWIRHTTWYPDRKIRLFDRRRGFWGGLNPHDRFQLKKSKYSSRHAKGDILHYSYYSVREHINQINNFTDIVALSKHKQCKSVTFIDLIIHPIWRFFRELFMAFSFLEGFYGIVITINTTYETFLKYVKLKILVDKEKNKEPYKIAFINTTMSWGGGEKWHYEMSKYLNDKKYNIILVTNKKSELFNRIINSSLRYYEIVLNNLSFLNPVNYILLYKLFKRERVKTIILNLSIDLKVAGLSAKLAGVKNIIYRRGSAIPIRNTLLNRFLFKNVVTNIIANSEETKRTILQNNLSLFPEKKINVIYNGIELDKFDQMASQVIFQKNNHEILIGNAGRLVHQKGQKYLIDLAIQLKKKGKKFKIIIAGDGRLENDLRNYAIQNNVDSYIVFLGFVDNIKSFMNTIDIFVLTSLWEGFGYVLIEAMACYKPVVAFDISSNPEIIEDKKTGYLVPFADISTLTNYTIDLLDNPVLREEMGKIGRKRVEDLFQVTKTQQNLEKFISQID